ncbi:MAG: hypothetical protein KGJ75_11825 [Alphaproteobacteria bacterium]|nr:hypothetical protein [Alphaproteobacteria bacterium]MDE2074246.1 hypothetical protein [Alphaproteobacteria bacterium]MDE2352985.1 hypothetical protein [Alphaproteobacteria bacterium]
MSNTPCDVLAERFEKKAADGLIDVKFFLQSHDGMVLDKEEVCAEVNRLYDAVEAGKAKPLDFGDLRWREAK